MQYNIFAVFNASNYKNTQVPPKSHKFFDSFNFVSANKVCIKSNISEINNNNGDHRHWKQCRECLSKKLD